MKETVSPPAGCLRPNVHKGLMVLILDEKYAGRSAAALQEAEQKMEVCSRPIHLGKRF